jgi:uncharacterized protein YceK
MRNLVIAIVAVVATAGCGAVHRNEAISASPGFDQGRFSVDQKACGEQSVGQADKKSIPTFGQTFNREAYNDCMRGRGWDVDSLQQR